MTEEKKTWEDLSIEESFDYLDRVLARLENKDSSLEDSFAAYQEGTLAIKAINDKIDAVDRKVQILDAQGQTSDLTLSK